MCAVDLALADHRTIENILPSIVFVSSAPPCKWFQTRRDARHNYLIVYGTTRELASKIASRPAILAKIPRF